MAATFVLIFWGFLMASIFMADLVMELDEFLKPKTKKNVLPEGRGNIERMLTNEEWEETREFRPKTPSRVQVQAFDPVPILKTEPEEDQCIWRM
ncbi:hypothetical protein TSUD_353410 [Trifolium subterraneum]|uniref:Uncharacterized protein n=1 Tax=Trifolium subterraneum TaxID=3900 RepID=A0A2Z6P1I5_TRISU|nr:hypothetical protein TSUD_353410 [Trifolium subterraneum]